MADTPAVTMCLGIDPGTEQSAYALWNGQTIVSCDIFPNRDLRDLLGDASWSGIPVYVEMIASYGMPVGASVFKTVLWIGRFQEICEIHHRPCELVYRTAIKVHHCHSSRAKDANVAQALRDKYGAVGTKSKPGPLYGVKTHIWSALAVATYAFETFRSTKA